MKYLILLSHILFLAVCLNPKSKLSQFGNNVFELPSIKNIWQLSQVKSFNMIS
jgi:hypothetical protein